MAASIRSAEELVKRAIIEPGVLERIRTDPVSTLQTLATQVVDDLPSAPPLESDVWIYRIVVGTIGLVALLAVVGAIGLTALGSDRVPDVLTAIGSASIGALAGLLSPFQLRK